MSSRTFPAEQMIASKGMLFDGAAATQCVDTAGESVVIAGVDCSAFDDPGGIPLNFEHKQKEVPVGRVVSYRKIFTEADCLDDRQRHYWTLCRRTPYIYVVCRLQDAAGDPEAIRIAASIRDHAAHGEPIMCRFSIEGQELERRGGVIEACIWRALAVTIQPANRTAVTGLVADPMAPPGFEFQPVEVAKSLQHDPRCRPIGGATVVTGLYKSLEGGNYNVASDTLTGGAALQTEDLGTKLRDVVGAFPGGDRAAFLAYAAKRLPGTPDDVLEKLADAAVVAKAEDPLAERFQDLYADVVAGFRADLVALRKSMDEVLPAMPRIYRVDFRREDGTTGLAGRFMLGQDDQVHHLEDYHGHLATLVPPGPMAAPTRARVEAWTQPGVRVTPDAQTEHADPAFAGTPDEPRAPVFDYLRAGFAVPHVLEFGSGGAALDGSPLADDELALLLENIENGTASLRYRAPGDLSKAESLTKDVDWSALEDGGAGDDHAANMVDAVRAAEAAGHVPKGTAAGITRHVYGDKMVPGVGNKYAHQQFLKDPRLGVHVAMDLNGFKGINDTYGHQEGDRSIGAAGAAFRDAGKKVGSGKVFRSGGDEFSAWFPTMQDAHQFAHHAATGLDAALPAGGKHRLSSSFGFGHTPEAADAALYDAKAQKKDSTGAARYAVGQVPNLAHSKMPGAEGPVDLKKPPVFAAQEPRAA